MPKCDSLFCLVKSLSKTEKRHFKIFASLKSDNTNYLRLFDAINKQEAYNEDKIKEKFRGEKFVNQLHVTKNHLVKLILKSLRGYYSNLSVETEINICIRNVEILFTKELYEQCGKEINRGLKIAETYEKFTQILQLITWQRKLLLAKQSTSGTGEELYELISKEETILKKKHRVNKYWQMVALVSAVFKGKRTWDDIISTEEFKNPEAADSLQAKILYYHLHYTYYITNNKLQDALNALDELLLLIESHPHRITDDPGSYITTLNNKVGLLLTIRKLDEIPELIEKIKSVPDEYKLKNKSGITVKLLLRTYNVELEMYRDTHDWVKGAEKIKEISEFLAKYENNVPGIYKLLFYYQFAYIYFMKNDLDKSLRWTNEIINEKFSLEREDILSYARFLNLIIHFELKNVTVLKYAVDSTRRFLNKKRNLREFEKTLLHFFSKVSMDLPEKHFKLLAKLKDELFVSTNIKEKEDILDYLDFESWIDDKLIRMKANAH